MLDLFNKAHPVPRHSPLLTHTLKTTPQVISHISHITSLKSYNKMSDKLNNMFDDINESDKDRTRALGKLVKKNNRINQRILNMAKKVATSLANEHPQTKLVTKANTYLPCQVPQAQHVSNQNKVCVNLILRYEVVAYV